MELPDEHKSTITKEIIQPFLNPIFFETGTWYGGGLMAARDAGFKRLYGLELDSELAKNAKKLIPEAIIICGDSRFMFEYNINKLINEPTTFFLDAHHQKEGQPFVTTAIHELIAISSHPLVNDFTILIDDIRLFRSSYWGVTFETLVNTTKQIKPNVKIDYIDNRLFKNDIMVIT